MATGGCSQPAMWTGQPYGQYPSGPPQPSMAMPPNYMSQSQNEGTLSKILHRLGGIETSLGKLSNIEKNVDLMNHKLDCVDKRVKETEAKVNKLEESVSFISAQYDSVQADIKSFTVTVKEKLEPELQKMTGEVYRTSRKLHDLQRENRALKETLNEQEYQKMSSNLIFSGLAEEDGKEAVVVLQEFIRDKSKMRLPSKAQSVWANPVNKKQNQET